jgi:hypothetical protein
MYREYGHIWLIVLLFVVNIKLLTQSPEKRCVRYKYIYISIFAILLLLDINDIRVISQERFGYGWLFLLLLVVFILHRNTEYETVEKDGTLNIPPKDIQTKSKRINATIIAIIILGASAYLTNKLAVPILATRSVLYLYLLYNAITYKSCSYNLPISWNE